MTIVRMSLSFIFSPDSREVFACFLKTVERLSCRTTFVRHSYECSEIISHCKFAESSRRQVRDTRANDVRLSHDSRATVLRHVLAKKFAYVLKHV